MTYYGYITDALDEMTPIAGATVTLQAGGRVIAREAANQDGFFSINTIGPADTITLTSAGYKPVTFPASPYQQRFEMERNPIQLPTVNVYAQPTTPRLSLYRPQLDTYTKAVGIGVAALLLLALMKNK